MRLDGSGGRMIEVICVGIVMIIFIGSMIIIGIKERRELARGIDFYFLNERNEAVKREEEFKNKEEDPKQVDTYIRYDEYRNFRTAPRIHTVPSVGKTKCTVRMKDEKENEITFACKIPFKEMMVKLEEDGDMFIVGGLCIAREEIKEIVIYL